MRDGGRTCGQGDKASGAERCIRLPQAADHSQIQPDVTPEKWGSATGVTTHAAIIRDRRRFCVDAWRIQVKCVAVVQLRASPLARMLLQEENGSGLNSQPQSHGKSQFTQPL